MPDWSSIAAKSESKQKKVIMAKSVDYSLYLVTDSTPAILGDASLVDVVEAALEGGVTIVQYRDKSTDTGVMVDTARRLHAVTKKYNVPLLINDRVDVALAVGCEGVHIGQDDIGEAIFHIKPGLYLNITQISKLPGASLEIRPSLASQLHRLSKHCKGAKMGLTISVLARYLLHQRNILPFSFCIHYCLTIPKEDKHQGHNWDCWLSSDPEGNGPKV
jgi:hypothetical protein